MGQEFTNTHPKKIALIFLICILIVAIIGPLFCSNAPWKTNLNGKTVYPAWTYYLNTWGKALPVGWSKIEWKKEAGIKNLVPFSPNYIDLTSVGGVGPGKNDHILGTDLMGRDVLSNLVHGSQVSFRIAFLATGIGLMIALIFVFFTSYLGNDRYYFSLWQWIAWMVMIILGYYYFFVAFAYTLEEYWFYKIVGFLGFVFGSFAMIEKILRKTKFLKRPVSLDLIGLKIYELVDSIPSLVILLILVGVLSQENDNYQILKISIILGLLLWTVFYQYLRVEILKAKGSDQFIALKNLGMNDFRIAVLHILPGALQTIIVPILFVASACILSEASLSFLGIGLTDADASWGRLLAQARLRVDAWWLAVFPGLMIFLVLYSMQVLAKKNSRTQ